jgi:hypothetical protein
LISDSQQGKADARASCLANAAASLYESESAVARAHAEAIARDIGRFTGPALTARFSTLARQVGLVRAKLTAGSRTVAEVGGQERNRTRRGGSRAAGNRAEDGRDRIGADSFSIRA